MGLAEGTETKPWNYESNGQLSRMYEFWIWGKLQRGMHVRYLDADTREDQM